MESESAYAQRIQDFGLSRSSSSSSSTAEPTSPTTWVVVSVPQFLEENLDPQEQPAVEQLAGEGSERRDIENAEGLPVGRLPSKNIRRVVQQLYAISTELRIALYDTRLPPGLVASCQQAEDAAFDCAEALEGKGLSRDEVDLSLADSRRIRDAVNTYCAYLHDRAEADEPSNAEFWALQFSGRSPPFLPWIEDEHPAEVGISRQEEEAPAKDEEKRTVAETQAAATAQLKAARGMVAEAQATAERQARERERLETDTRWLNAAKAEVKGALLDKDAELAKRWAELEEEQERLRSEHSALRTEWAELHEHAAELETKRLELARREESVKARQRELEEERNSARKERNEA